MFCWEGTVDVRGKHVGVWTGSGRRLVDNDHRHILEGKSRLFERDRRDK